MGERKSIREDINNISGKEGHTGKIKTTCTCDLIITLSRMLLCFAITKGTAEKCAD